MSKFKGLCITIMKDLIDVYFPSNLDPAGLTSRSTAPVELQYGTGAAREVLIEDTKMLSESAKNCQDGV